MSKFSHNRLLVQFTFAKFNEFSFDDNFRVNSTNVTLDVISKQVIHQLFCSGIVCVGNIKRCSTQIYMLFWFNYYITYIKLNENTN